MYYQASWYAHQGLMDGTNFRTILLALRDEGMEAEADVVEGLADHHHVPRPRRREGERLQMYM